MRLAGLGADVLVHGRDRRPRSGRPRGRACRVRARPRPRCYVADLGTLAGVRGLAAEVVARISPRLDVLVANAGVFAPSGARRRRPGAHVRRQRRGALLLATELLPALRAAAPARIVVLSSASHWTGEIHWDDLQLAAPGAYAGLRAYDQSKLAVLMLTLALAGASRAAASRPSASIPATWPPSMLASGWPGLPGIPVEDGAVTSVYLASSPEAAGVSGVYFEDGAAVTPLAAALDVPAQERLWAARRGTHRPARRVAPGIHPA